MSDLTDLNFDASQVEPDTGFDVIPAGEYDAVIVKSEVKPTKAGTGRYVNLQLQICSGPYQNRVLFDTFNLWNPNPKAVEIARAQFSGLCRAIGVLAPKKTEELHNKVVRISLKIEKDEQYGDQNKVKGYKSRQTGPAPSSPAPAGVPVGAGAGAPAASPWGN